MSQDCWLTTNLNENFYFFLFCGTFWGVLRERFPKHTVNKLKGGIFTGPEPPKNFRAGTLRNGWQFPREMPEIHFEQLLTDFWATGKKINLRKLFIHSSIYARRKWMQNVHQTTLLTFEFGLFFRCRASVKSMERDSTCLVQFSRV